MVIHFYWNNGLPWEYECRENMAFEYKLDGIVVDWRIAKENGLTVWVIEI